jgi:hypothetical protein
MVRAMAVRLGISLERADSELFLLPVAIDAIVCPLPSGWEEEEAPHGGSALPTEAGRGGGAGASGYCFRQLVTGEVRDEHPLLHDFAEHVASQRRRKNKPRKWGHLEGWMQFATSAGQVHLARTRRRDTR